MSKPERAWVVRGRKLPEVFQQWRERGVAAVYWSRIGDLTRYPTREAIRQALEASGSKPETARVHAGELWRFAREIRPGDWVLTSDETGHTLWVGVVREGYRYDPQVLGKEAPHIVRVQWYDEVQRSDFPETVRRSLASGLTVFDLSEHMDAIRKVVPPPPGEEPPPPPERPVLQAVLGIASEAATQRWDRNNEKETITKVVIPMVEALGWRRWGEHAFHAEYPVFHQDHVDLALKINDRPVAFVEVKPYDMALDPEGKVIKQVLHYAQDSTPPVRWAVLTNGRQWILFDAHLAHVSHSKKLVFAVDLAEDSSERAAKPLMLLTPQSIASGRTEKEALKLRVAAAVSRVLAKPPKELLRAIANETGEERVSGGMAEAVQQVLARLAAAVHAADLLE